MAKNTTVGPWLERQIRRRELSQAEFSRRMKVSTGTVSNWITGQRVPNPEYCDRIADILAVDLYIVYQQAGIPTKSDAPSPDDPRYSIQALVDRVDWSKSHNVLLARRLLLGMIEADEIDRAGEGAG